MNQLRLTLLTSTLIAGTCMAQWANPRPALNQLGAATTGLPQNILPATNDDLRAGGDIIWSEDFANGLAGNNGVGAWTTSGPNGNIWKRAVSGPNGAYTNPAASRIQSTTVANGYMLFNSDSVNSSWVGNTPTALDPSTFTSWEGSLESPVLDLSATPFVEFVFQQRLRYCCGDRPQLLEVSTDGGTTWPSSFDIAVNWAANESTLSPTETFKLNLTNAISADPSNVRIRFRHSADAGSSHYHWQIDDIRIVELYPFDLRMTGAATTSWDGTLATSYDSLKYTVFPYSQLRPIGLNMTALNNGSEIVDDAVANFKVERQGGAVVLDQDQALASWAQGEERTIFVAPSFTPPAETGTYNVTFGVGSDNPDQTPNDNTKTSSFKVSEYAYGRDAGALSSSQAAGTGTLIMTNAFYVANAVELHSISVVLATGSEIGSLVVGELRGDNLDDVLATSDEKIVTAAILSPMGGSNFVNLIFDPPVSLQAGMDYMASVQVYGNVRIGQSGSSEPQTSFLFYDGQNGEAWYYTTTTPMIRMNFDPTVGIDEADASNTIGLGQNIPNPSNGTTAIPYEVKEAGAVSFQLRDVTGKLVKEQFIGNQAPGVYRFNVNTEVLPEGVYFYTLNVGAARATKRMSVVH